MYHRKPYAPAVVVILYGAGAALLAGAAAAVARSLPRAVLALFLAAPLVAFYPDLAGGRTRLPADQTYSVPKPGAPPARARNPWLNDLASQFVPWAVKTRAAWRSGELPLRDYWNGCGSAFAGGPAAPFSPFAVLFALLTVTRAFGAAAALKAFAALTGTWLWLRELGASTSAALLGAVSFALSFAIAPWIFFPIAAGAAALPWVFFAAERLRDRSHPGRAFALLVAVFATWPLFGHVESVFMGVCLLGLVLLVRWLSGGLPDAAPLCRRILLAGAAGAGLAAFVLLPQFFAVLASNRRALASAYLFQRPWTWVPHGFLWPGWRTTLFPRAFGDLVETPMLPVAKGAFTEIALGYAGIVAWSFALLVWRPGSRRASVTPALVAAIALLLGLALGAWPFAELAHRIPIVSWTLPVRWLSGVSFAAATLGALEFDRWRRDLGTPSAAGAAAALAAVAATLALLAVDTHRRYYAAMGPPGSLPAAAAGLRLTLWALAAVLAAALLGGLPAPAFRHAAAALVIAAATAELSLQAARLYRTWPAGDVYPRTPMADFFRAQSGRFRVVGEGSEFFPQRNAMLGLEDVRTHDPTERRDYVGFLDATVGYPPADYYKRITRIDAPALAFLNTRFMVSFPGRGASGPWRPVYSGPDGSVLESERVLPRVFAPARVVGVAGAAPSGAVIDGLRPFRGTLSRIASLEDFGATAFVLGAADGGRPNGPVTVTGYDESGRRVRFDARAEAPATLVTSLVQDGGWTARDDTGRPLPTTLANGPFLALRVPAGATRVLLYYAPPGWSAGTRVALLTAVLLGAAALRHRARRRSPEAA